jgi:hypothetical protein
MKLQLKRNVKKALVFAIALFFALAGVYAYTQIYWQRTITTSIDVVGIDAECLTPTIDGFRNKIATTTLTDGKILLTVYSENFNDIWLNVTWTSNATGLVVSAVGETVHVYNKPYIDWVYELQGDPRDVMGYTVFPDKQKVYYSNGMGMQITFSFNTEAITVPGHYAIEISLALGFVG